MNPPTPGIRRVGRTKEGVGGPGVGLRFVSKGTPAEVRSARARSLELALGLSREGDANLWTSEDSRSTLRDPPGEGFRPSMFLFWGARTPPNLRFRSKENGIRTPRNIFPESVLRISKLTFSTDVGLFWCALRFRFRGRRTWPQACQSADPVGRVGYCIQGGFTRASS